MAEEKDNIVGDGSVGDEKRAESSSEPTDESVKLESADEVQAESAVNKPEESEAVAELAAEPKPETEQTSSEAATTDGSTEQNPENSVDVPIAKDKTIDEAMKEADENSESDAFKPDAEVDAAVDDIVRTESDESIAEADAKVAAVEAKRSKKSLPKKIKGAFVAWWQNKPVRYGTFAAMLAVFTTIVLLPMTRYTALNAIGVRVSTSMVVVDSQTRLPLKNISVELQQVTATTDELGEVAFSDMKLGNSDLTITKRGYADNSREIVLGWGSNPIGEQELVATGEQFTFVLKDWKSNDIIAGGEATSGENSAIADDGGIIVLTVGEESIADVEVIITAPGYRDEVLTGETLEDTENIIVMVPGRKHVFVTNRSGQYDLFKIDVDGQNEESILEATGKEREVPTVLPHPTRDIVAFVSSRDGQENSDGFALDGLYIVDVESGEEDRIGRSEQIRLIGWSEDNLLYWQVVEGTSRGNPERSKLISYNERTKERTEIAAANYFNDVKLVNDTVYYAVSSFAVPVSQAKLYTSKADGTDKLTLIDTQVWNIYRTGHNILLFGAAEQKWYEQVGAKDVEEVGKQLSPTSLKFVDNPSGSKTAWVEVRDGKGVLLVSNLDKEEIVEEQVVSLAGLNQVQYWVDDSTVVFRVISNSETADYVLSLVDGLAQKIVDVTATQDNY